LQLQKNEMHYHNKIKSISLLLVSILFICFSCKKNKNIIQVEGTVFDPNTNEYVANVNVVLSASKLSSGGIFSSGYEDIATMTTDASGTFSCEFKEEKFSGYQIRISKEHYFELVKELTTSDIVAGSKFSPTYSIYPECFIRMEVRNVIPLDTNDYITYNFTGGWVSCYECCDNTLYSGIGMNYSDTLICRTYGNQNVTLTYNVTKGGTTLLHTLNHYCNAFDTTKFIVSY
jgi:hypothetical protein